MEKNKKWRHGKKNIYNARIYREERNRKEEIKNNEMLEENRH